MCLLLLDSNIFVGKLLSLCLYIPAYHTNVCLNKWMNSYPWHLDSQWANSHFNSLTFQLFKERLKSLCSLLGKLKPNHILKDKWFYFIFPFEVIYKQFHFLLLYSFTHTIQGSQTIPRQCVESFVFFSSSVAFNHKHVSQNYIQHYNLHPCYTFAFICQLF